MTVRVPKRLLSMSITLLGLGAVGVIVWKADATETIVALGRAGVEGYGFLLAATLMVLCSQTLGWLIMLRAEGIAASWWRTLEAMTVGFLVAYLTPSMYLGGEPVRALMIAKTYGVQRRRVFGTIIVHKFAEFSGFLAALAVAVFATVGSSDLPSQVRHALWGGLILFAVFFGLLTLSMVGHRKPLERFCRWRARRGRRPEFWNRAAERVGGMEDTIEAAFREHLRATLVGGFLTACPIAIVYVKPALFFLAHEGAPVLDFSALSLTFALSQMLLALQFTPGGVGIFEGGQVGIYALVGVKAPVALAYTALLRAVEATLCLAGAWLGVRFGLSAWGGTRSST